MHSFAEFKNEGKVFLFERSLKYYNVYVK